MNYYMYSLESIYTTMEIYWTFDDNRERYITLSITHKNSIPKKEYIVCFLRCYKYKNILYKILESV